jgi:hypothetical protein
MDPADIAALFYGDEATGPEKAQQLAAALRGDTQLGQLGMLTGDKVLGGVGQSLVQGAQQGQQALEKAANMRLTRAMEAEKQKTEQEFRQSQEKHMAAQEAISRAQLAQGHFMLSPPTASSPGYVIDSRTGKPQPLLPQAPGSAGNGLSKQEEKEFIDFMNSITTSGGKGSSPQLKQQADRLNASKRMLASATNPDGTPKNLDPTMMTELMANMGAVLSSGGQPAEGLIHNLTPKTLGGDVAKIQQWVTGNPTGADQQAFVQQAINLAKREEATIEPQIRAAQMEKVPGFVHLRQKDRARFDRTLRGVGIDPATVDDSGALIALEKAAAAGGGATGGGGLSPADQKAVDWAKKNPGNPDAQNILKLHHMAP